MRVRNLIALLSLPLWMLVIVDRVSAADTTTGGATGDTVWAGVQTGTPPSTGGADSRGCRWTLASVDNGDWSTGFVKTVDGVVYDLFRRDCTDTITVHWIPRVTSSTLARNASVMVAARLPDPVLQMAPPADLGVVGVPTWLWIGADRWQSVSATAWVPTAGGTVWARTTATPRRITFTTQDDGSRTGSETVVIECEGRGDEWSVETGDEIASTCSHTYRHSSAQRPSGVFVAVVSIEWETTFRSSTGGSGTLEPLRTSAIMTVSVDELQALVG